MQGSAITSYTIQIVHAIKSNNTLSTHMMHIKISRVKVNTHTLKTYLKRKERLFLKC